MKRAKTIMLAVLAVLVVALGAAAGLLGYRISGLRRYQEQLSLGEKYLAELDYENAEICFQKAIEINEKRVASYVRLSVVYVKQQRYSEAREMLEKAAEYADPKGEESVDWIEQQIETVEKEEEKQNPGSLQDAGGQDKEGQEPQKEGQQAEELFTAYLQNTLIPQKGQANLDPQEGWMYSQSDSWYNPLGITSALLEDLDGDGDLEMLVIAIEDPQDPGDYYPDGKDLTGAVYEIVQGEVQQAAFTVLQEYNPLMGEYKPHTFLLPQADQIDLYVSLVEAENRKYLFCQRYELGAAFADGSTQDYWMMYYQDGELKMRASFTQPGMGSSEFQFMGYLLENGQEVSGELLYSEAYGEPGKYSTFDEALKAFFGPLGIETAFTDHMTSILTDESQETKILSYHTGVKERSSDYRSSKFGLDATDYTGLGQRLEGAQPDSQAAGQPSQEPETGEELTAAQAGEAVAAYYNENYQPQGKYVVFESETTEEAGAYKVLVRYQPGEGEVGTANRLMCAVTVDKTTGEAPDDLGNSWNVRD
ncbi:MAG TPA: tetratricopeptide repeat protein [Candidatus Egerieimonas intestinavium]|uniref:Tetratricopeptide repeat protein n=1 Tax=Candidatus Egerieimonas intestinavium TaxID=2840777 RepID=A0A9D1EKQ3_9FIRM|nr:tetratricopeptide repeat protein [Candidatus Egerieimonas intestinavium]